MKAITLSLAFFALAGLTYATADDLLVLNYTEYFSDISTCPQVNDISSDRLNALREQIILKNSKVVIKYFTDSCDEKDTHILSFNAYLNTLYNADLVRAIYVTVVDLLYPQQSAELLAAKLWKIYRSGNADSLNIMLETQLYLLNKFTKLGDLNDQYLINVGYYLYKAQRDRTYPQLERRVRIELEAAILRLPPTLQHFYFKPDFCLYNKGYDEYMYTGAPDLKESENVRYIFNWIPAGGEMSQGAWLKQFHVLQNETTSGALPYKLSLRGRKYDKYMYMDGERDNLIAAWEPDYAPEGSKWSLQLVEGALVFEQDGKLMCASPKVWKYGARRFIYGYDDTDHSEMSEFCQWNAVDCPLS